LTGNTWLQAPGEDDLILGQVRYQSPCGGYSTVDVNVYVDVALIGTLTLVPLPSGATATFSAAVNLPAPARALRTR
jgi:hypothetical protein